MILSKWCHRPAEQCWRSLLQTSFICDSPDTGHRQKFLLYNILLSSWLLFNGTRVGWSHLFFHENIHHVLGHTFAMLGSVSKLFSLVCGLAFLQLMMFRLLACLWAYMGVVPIDLHRMTSSAGTSVALVGETKEMMAAKLLHAANVAGQVIVFTSAIVIVTGNLVINISVSDNSIQIICWCFWWLFDAIMSVVVTDLVLFPAIFIMDMVQYRFHLMKVCSEIPVAPASVLMAKLEELAKAAHHINHFLSPILSLQTLFTTPLACLTFFMGISADSHLIAIGMPIVAVNLLTFAFALQWFAGHVTATSQQLLCKLTAMLTSSHWATGERMRILQQLEHMSSVWQAPLAVHSCCGEPLTLVSFVAYVLETGVQFSLVLTFSCYLLT